jgi:signal transduction histidine kinase
MADPNVSRSWHDAWILKSKQICLPKMDSNSDSGFELKTFQQNLLDTIQTRDLNWVEPWLVSLSPSFHEKRQKGDSVTLTGLVNALMRVTFEAIIESSPAEEAVKSLEALVPCFGKLYETALLQEIQVNSDQIKDNLAETQYKLEQLERSKSNFTSIAAHELKTPLTLIEGYTAILHETISRRNGFENELKLLDGIQNGAVRLNEIINDMIDVSLIDNRMLKPNIQPVWLNHVFNGLRKDLNKALKDRHQNLEITAFPGYEEMIHGDPERLTQVFRNILTNAIKFTPDGGSITISGQRLPGFIEITVRDTGIGIAPEEQKIIFEKFSRLGKTDLHSTSKTNFKGGGPGLGLHISKGIIETLGGRIWAESNDRDGKEFPGTTFHVLLPVNYDIPNQRATTLREIYAKDHNNQ